MASPLAPVLAGGNNAARERTGRLSNRPSQPGLSGLAKGPLSARLKVCLASFERRRESRARWNRRWAGDGGFANGGDAGWLAGWLILLIDAGWLRLRGVLWVETATGVIR